MQALHSVTLDLSSGESIPFKRGINDKCPFCRTPRHKNDADALAMAKARVQKKDPNAMKYLGDQYSRGRLGLEKDMSRAVELWNEAAGLGSVGGCYELGLTYINGDGAEQDVARGVCFFEKAAMLGHWGARHNLGSYEHNNGNYDRAVRHFLISAKMGDKDSLEEIKDTFTRGLATKTQYAEALKGYQDALEELKSPEREEAKTHPLFN